MGRVCVGNAYFKHGKWYARLTLGNGERPSIMLPTCADEMAARLKAALLSELVTKLRTAGQLEYARPVVTRAAERDGKALDEVLRAVELIISGKATPKHNCRMLTVAELSKRWTNGELARAYPDHIRHKRSAQHDAWRLDRYIVPIIGDVRMDKLTLDHAEAVMRSVPPDLAPATRRQVAQIMNRLCMIAVFPLRLIPSSPLPKGFLPKVGTGKAKGWIYPDEDAKLIGSPNIPFEWRVFYGFLHREGPRRSEAVRLTWSDFDLERGAVTLDENKTDDPRAWALSPGVTESIRALRKMRANAGGDVSDDALVFVDENGESIAKWHAAATYREHLRAAGITRAILFERSHSRQPIRLHDTRATFITISLANGKSEAWVQDRTGHRSSTMINRYRRQARTVADLGLGGFVRMDVALGLCSVPDVLPEKITNWQTRGFAASTPSESKGYIRLELAWSTENVASGLPPLMRVLPSPGLGESPTKG